MAGLDLRVHVEARRAGHMRAFARLGPGRGMKPVLDGGFHQGVIGGMEADEIDASPISIVRVELGRALVRQRPQLQKFGRPRASSESSERIAWPSPRLRAATASFSAGSETKRLSVDQFDRLVDDLVSDRAKGSRGLRKLSCRIDEGVHGSAISLSPGYSFPRRSAKQGLARRRHESRDVLTGGYARRFVRSPLDPRPRRPRGRAFARSRRRATLAEGQGEADDRREHAAPACSASRGAAGD